MFQHWWQIKKKGPIVSDEQVTIVLIKGATREGHSGAAFGAAVGCCWCCCWWLLGHRSVSPTAGRATQN